MEAKLLVTSSLTVNDIDSEKLGSLASAEPPPSTNRHILVTIPDFNENNNTPTTTTSKQEEGIRTDESVPQKNSRYKGLFVAASYGLVSMCAVVVNKAVLSSWHFNFPLTMIACQMVISFLLLWALKRCSLIEYDDWSLDTAQKVAPMAIAHVVNVLLGLLALDLVDIPMFGALRRTSIIFVLVMEFIILNKLASWQVFASTLLLLLGAVVGGWGDLHFDPFGYGLTFVVNVTTALSLTLIPKLGTSANLNAFGLMLYQITVSFPIVLLFILITGEYRGVMAYSHLHETSFQMSFFISSAQIFLVNYTLFLCTQMNSPLTTTVTGTIKNIGETMLGFAFFSVPMDPINLLGIFIGFLGSVTYTLVKYMEQTQQPKKPERKDCS